MKVNFSLEIKMFFKRAAYININKAHYYFLTYNEENNSWDRAFWKIRGFQYSEQQLFHPVFLFLKHCCLLVESDPLFEKFTVPNEGYYTEKRFYTLMTGVVP